MIGTLATHRPTLEELEAWNIPAELVHMTTRYVVWRAPEPLMVIGEVPPQLLSAQIYLWAEMIGKPSLAQLRAGRVAASHYLDSLPYTVMAEAARGDNVGRHFLTALGFRLVTELPDRFVLQREK